MICNGQQPRQPSSRVGFIVGSYLGGAVFGARRCAPACHSRSGLGSSSGTGKTAKAGFEKCGACSTKLSSRCSPDGATPSPDSAACIKQRCCLTACAGHRTPQAHRICESKEAGQPSDCITGTAGYGWRHALAVCITDKPANARQRVLPDDMMIEHHSYAIRNDRCEQCMLISCYGDQRLAPTLRSDLDMGRPSSSRCDSSGKVASTSTR